MIPLLTVSGMDEAAPFAGAPWVAQVYVCGRCASRPTKLPYEHS